ncbi:DUF2764 family protein [Spirochaeta lutea]|uniref:DUF2764 family protein n=1 Tax=Spirochaeta lutea TaxID=1480694 RepID=UPI0009DD885C|nr:DUF2764 family protein [Spirochaeta lutea]
MSQYYYLVSTLPALFLGGEPSLTPEHFLSQCSDWLSARDIAILRNTNLIPPAKWNETSTNALLLQWWEFEYLLRNELTAQRASNFGKSPEEFFRAAPGSEILRGFGHVADAVRSTIQDSNPLQAEVGLNELRWGFLDELSLSHFFDLEALQVYYLRLLIATRQSSFSVERGTESYKNHYDRVVEKLDETQNNPTEIRE